VSRPPFSNLTAYGTRLAELVRGTKPGYTDADFVDEALRRYAEDFPCEVTVDIGDGTTTEWMLGDGDFARFDRAISDAWPVRAERLASGVPVNPREWFQADTDFWIDSREAEVAAPAAPVLALAGVGAGNVDNGAHTVKVTFVLPEGETAASAASNSITVADKTTNGKLAVSGIPLGPSACTARKLYLLPVGGTVWRLVTTISDNTTTTATLDSTDASIAATAAAPSDALVVPRQYLVWRSAPATDAARVRFRRRWRVSDSPVKNEVAVQHQDAVCYLAAEFKCLALADYYADTVDANGGSDVFEGKSTAETYRSLAKDWRAKYSRIVGLGQQGGSLTAGTVETGNLRVWPAWSANGV
jgi:hypothetical protein